MSKQFDVVDLNLAEDFGGAVNLLRDKIKALVAERCAAGEQSIRTLLIGKSPKKSLTRRWYKLRRKGYFEMVVLAEFDEDFALRLLNCGSDSCSLVLSEALGEFDYGEGIVVRRQTRGSGVSDSQMSLFVCFGPGVDVLESKAKRVKFESPGSLELSADESGVNSIDDITDLLRDEGMEQNDSATLEKFNEFTDIDTSTSTLSIKQLATNRQRGLLFHWKASCGDVPLKYVHGTLQPNCYLSRNGADLKYCSVSVLKGRYSELVSQNSAALPVIIPDKSTTQPITKNCVIARLISHTTTSTTNTTPTSRQSVTTIPSTSLPLTSVLATTRPSPSSAPSMLPPTVPLTLTIFTSTRSIPITTMHSLTPALTHPLPTLSQATVSTPSVSTPSVTARTSLSRKRPISSMQNPSNFNRSPHLSTRSEFQAASTSNSLMTSRPETETPSSPSLPQVNTTLERSNLNVDEFMLEAKAKHNLLLGIWKVHFNRTVFSSHMDELDFNTATLTKKLSTGILCSLATRVVQQLGEEKGVMRIECLTLPCVALSFMQVASLKIASVVPSSLHIDQFVIPFTTGDIPNARVLMFSIVAVAESLATCQPSCLKFVCTEHHNQLGDVTAIKEKLANSSKRKGWNPKIIYCHAIGDREVVVATLTDPPYSLK